MVPRGGTPLGHGAPSLEASNQAQIDDLVQRNRTLEHTVKKLTDRLSQETIRSKDAATEIQKQWQVAQSEWRQGCDILQSCHRVVQLRNTVELEKERMNVLKELDITRMERVKRLQRDFRITMFQARETELEERIAELQEERQSILTDAETTARQLKGKSSEHVAQLQAKCDELVVAEQEKEELEEKLEKLQEDNVHLQSSAHSLSSKLERTTLQLEGARTKHADLERTNEELKRTNADIHRQLEKWQNLETKDGAEIETQRKRRIELEVQVRDLELQLERSAEEKEKAVEKEKRRIEKLKDGMEQLQAAADKHEKESKDLKKQLTKSQKQLSKLTSELEVERARVRPPSPQKKQSSPPSDNEVQESAPPTLARPKPRPTKPKPQLRKRAEPDNAEAGPSSTHSDIEEIPRAKAQAKTKNAPASSNSDSEDAPQKTKAKAKGKAKAAEGPVNDAPVDPTDDLPTKKRTGKRKAAKEGDQNSDVEIVESQPTKTKNSKRTTSELLDANTKTKPATRSVNVQQRAGGRDEEGAATSDVDKEAPKKKRRKINIFPAAEPTAFNFMSSVDGGLGIPTVLSPVKDSDSVPGRSTSGSVFGSIGDLLKKSFPRR